MDTRRKDRRDRSEKHLRGAAASGGGAPRAIIASNSRREVSTEVTGRRLSRPQARQIAEETVNILLNGGYTVKKSGNIDLSERLRFARDNTQVVENPPNTALRFSAPHHAKFVRESGRPPNAMSFALAVLEQQRRKYQEQLVRADGGAALASEEAPTLHAAIDAITLAATDEAGKSEDDCHEGDADTALLVGDLLDFPPMVIEVVLQTTLSAVRSLCGSGTNCCALNFASAKNPGGGFLKGSTAQEESLARTTGLYHCIGPNSAATSLYALNRGDNNNCLYSHALAYSPSVPFFRNDDCALLTGDQVCCAAILTCPAVNAKHAIPRVGLEAVRQTMLQRICRVVSVMEKKGHDAIVLGAYGCGVFGNSVEDVARCFLLALAGRSFRQVRFAVISEADAAVFRQVFELETGTD